MGSTRHFKLNVTQPVQTFYPEYTGDGMLLAVVCTGLSSSASLSGITGGSTTAASYISTVASGENEFTFYTTLSSSVTIYANVALIRPYGMYYYSSTALTLTTASTPSLALQYAVTSYDYTRTYITQGRLDEALDSNLNPYDFKNIWAAWKSRPYGDRNEVTAESLSTTTSPPFCTTRTGKSLVPAKAIFLNPSTTAWNSYYNGSYSPSGPMLLRGKYCTVIRTSHQVSIVNTIGIQFDASISWTLEPGISFHLHATIPTGTTTTQSTENSGVLNTQYLCNGGKMSISVTSSFTGTIKLSSYFGNFYFTQNITQQSLVYRFTSTSMSDCTFNSVTLNFSK